MLLPFLAAALLAVDLPADTARVARLSALVARRPHVAGDRANPDVLAALLEQLAVPGLDTMRTTFRAYLPQPRGPVLNRTQPYPSLLPNVELRVGDDSLTFGGIWPIFAPYSPDVDREAPIVYVNEGRAKDYRTLDSLRVSPEGTLVVARRSACAPWAIARQARAAGAAGLLLYSDPSRDGYMQGEYYPDGRMRHPDAAERTLARADVGDPGPDGAASAVPLPVLPIGYKVANQLLSLLQRPAVPNDWQGVLPFRHRAGFGEVRARLVLDAEKGDTGWKTLANGFVELRGTTRPEELILIGAHYDALGPGATDNGSGVTVATEVLHRLAEARRAGWRPARTVRLALWDGGEWGAVGSTQWLRAQPDSVLDRIVAYVDAKRLVAGDRLVITGAPMLADAAARAAEAVPAALAGVRPRAGQVRPRPGPDDAAVMHEGFGIPAIRIAFDGLDGVARTGYDTPTYLRRFVDPGWQRHDAVAAALTVLVRTLADSGAAAYRPARLRDALAADAPTVTATAGLGTLLASATRQPGFERRLLADRGRAPLGWSRHLLFGTDLDCGDRTMAFPQGANVALDRLRARFGATRPAAGAAR